MWIYNFFFLFSEEKHVTGSCTSCVSLFCPSCMEHQNFALRDVDNLLQRLEAAEGLFPSSKSFAQQYPLYKSPQFIARVKVSVLVKTRKYLSKRNNKNVVVVFFLSNFKLYSKVI